MKSTKKTVTPWPQDGSLEEKVLHGIHLVLTFCDPERCTFGEATHLRCLAKREAQAEKRLKIEAGSESSRTQKARPVYSDSDDDSPDDDSPEEDEEAEDYVFKVMSPVILLQGQLRRK